LKLEIQVVEEYLIKRVLYKTKINGETPLFEPTRELGSGMKVVAVSASSQYVLLCVMYLTGREECWRMDCY